MSSAERSATSDPMFEEIAESARQLAVSKWFVKDLLRKKKLKAKKAGRRTIIDVQSRKDYADALPDAEFSPPRLRRRAAMLAIEIAKAAEQNKA
jgi:hypothetical protein